MTLMLDPGAVSARRLAARTSVSPLRDSIAADLAVVMRRPLYVPEQKALLSREGGRCAEDGTLLEFDPYSPRNHRCGRCGRAYTGTLHDRWWIYWYQLWLAERTVHAATLAVLDDDADAAGFAGRVLDSYAELYPRYPNVDNVLGPTRPFFSTYLESIWTLQLCVATDLIESSTAGPGLRRITDRLRERVIAPSRSLISSYDEGASNRQVWNNAAMIAASLVLGRPDDAESVVWSGSGVVSHLQDALLADGSWYEGENYHFFAHRGLWYSVLMGEVHDFGIPSELVARFDRGFVAPIRTALPDLTFPSRRDSQYAVSLRQWRVAEMCELGLARTGDPLLSGMLHRLYGDDLERRETGRASSTAEAERNLPPTKLTRADLGWKSLLFAHPVIIEGRARPPRSTILEEQGYAILRRGEGMVYAALDYGHAGGGHGHPDRLNLLLMDGATRWLDDYGTGSYVDPSLHWYRSTLAHNAPMIGGMSQRRVDGELIAWEDRGAAGWVSARAAIAAGSEVRRTIVLMQDYLVDEIQWKSPSGPFDLPLHVDGEVSGARLEVTGTLTGSTGIEDGLGFLVNVGRIIPPADGAIRITAMRDGRRLDCWVASDQPLELWTASAPGAPFAGEARFLIVRSLAPAGTVRLLWSWRGSVAACALLPEIVVDGVDGRHEHRRVDHGWSVAMHVGGARSSIDLEGLVEDRRPGLDPDPRQSTGPATTPGAPSGGAEQPDAGTADPVDPVRAAVLRPDRPLRLRLGEESYRRSEQSWMEAGRPSAEVALMNEDGTLVIEVSVTNADRSFTAATAVNPFDNEHADVNGAGLQLYLRTDDGSSGYLLVPEPGSARVRVRPLGGWGAANAVEAVWTDIDNGWVIDVSVEGIETGSLVELDLVVNEKPASRDRRRGQLVLSGGAGEFVYLRGDRHDPSRLIPFVLADD